MCLLVILELPYVLKGFIEIRSENLFLRHQKDRKQRLKLLIRLHQIVKILVIMNTSNQNLFEIFTKYQIHIKINLVLLILYCKSTD